jgi:hypothetical protein
MRPCDLNTVYASGIGGSTGSSAGEEGLGWQPGKDGPDLSIEWILDVLGLEEERCETEPT